MATSPYRVTAFISSTEGKGPLLFNERFETLAVADAVADTWVEIGAPSAQVKVTVFGPHKDDPDQETYFWSYQRGP